MMLAVGALASACSNILITRFLWSGDLFKVPLKVCKSVFADDLGRNDPKSSFTKQVLVVSCNFFLPHG